MYANYLVRHRLLHVKPLVRYSRMKIKQRETRINLSLHNSYVK